MFCFWSLTDWLVVLIAAVAVIFFAMGIIYVCVDCVKNRKLREKELKLAEDAARAEEDAKRLKDTEALIRRLLNEQKKDR